MPKQKDKKQDKRLAKIERQIGKVEYKQHTLAVASTSLGAAVFTNNCLVAMAQGSSAITRVGNKIKVYMVDLRLQITSTINADDGVIAQAIRYMLWRDKASNGGTLSDNQVLVNSGSILSPVNLGADNSNIGSYLGRKYNDRNVVIYKDSGPQWVGPITNVLNAADNYTVPSTLYPAVRTFRVRKSFPKGIEVLYSATGTSVTTVNKNNIDFAIYSTSASLSYILQSTILYTDE